MKVALHQHFMLYKPYGYLSQFINKQTKRKNKRLLGALYDFPEGTMAIGRLDEKSEGLLLLTTNGKISELIRSNQVEKEYYVQVDGIISDAEISQLKNGLSIKIEGKAYQTKPCKAFILKSEPKLPERGKKIRDKRHGPTSWISITLTEGKFRQVRKMTAVIGFPTLRLVRIRIDKINLGTMKIGEVVALDNLFKEEIGK